MTKSSPLIQPIPRRTFEMTPISTGPPTPSRRRSNSSIAEPETGEIPSTNRTRSILNLTSSTLFGIYSPSGDEGAREEPSTPSYGAQTPARQSISNERPSPVIGVSGPALQPVKITQPHSSDGDRLPLILRFMSLFIFGMAYGLLVTHLHDHQQLAPIWVDRIDRHSWRYLISWGGAGVFLGGLLPWVDSFVEKAWEGNKNAPASNIKPATPISGIQSDEDEGSRSGVDSGLGADWNPIVRGIGAFIGIVFAIRRLPWQSTLQVSLTLALVNPFLWYLVDRSKPGFVLSTFVGIAGTMVVLGVNPEIMPTPAVPSVNHLLHDGLISDENVVVFTWISSVLFCSTVCFGNVGRKLALGHLGKG